MSIGTEIVRGVIRPYRKLEMKRRLIGNTRDYEATWIDITDYVIEWPTIERGVTDDHVFGDFILPKISVTLHNRNRVFEDQQSPYSLWYGTPTRYMTKFKITHGVYAKADGYTNTEVLGGTFYGVLFDEPKHGDDDTITISIGDILQVFKNYSADLLTSIPTGVVTSSLIQSFLDLQSGGVSIFDKFFEGAEVITTGTVTVQVPELEGKTVWEKMAEYAAIEGYIPEVGNDGIFYYKDRTPGTTVVWDFVGGTLFDQTYGDTIISVDEIEDGSNYVFNACTIKYDDTPSYANVTSAWTPGDGTSYDLFGERQYSLDLFDLDSTGASAAANKIVNANKTALRRYRLTTCYIPHLNTFDRVRIRYEGKPDLLTGRDALFWGIGRWGINRWSSTRGPIKINNKECKILNQKVDLNNFTSEFYLQEV